MIPVMIFALLFAGYCWLAEWRAVKSARSARYLGLMGLAAYASGLVYGHWIWT